jgi:predicted amidohydrolase
MRAAVHELVAQARTPGLLVLPEGVLNGYFSADPAGARQAALSVADLQPLANASRGSERAVLVGCTESAAGHLYNSAALIRNGSVQGVARKLHGTELGFAHGEHPLLFEVKGVKVGVLICRDARSAESAQELADRGAQVLAVPLNNLLPLASAERWRKQHLQILRERALQTGCWVASADVVGRESASQAYGCSVILDPRGQLRAQVPEGQAGLAASLDARSGPRR